MEFHCLLGVGADAYDPLDPNGNITIKWDVISWTPDGYLVSTINACSSFSPSLLMEIHLRMTVKFYQKLG